MLFDSKAGQCTAGSIVVPPLNQEACTSANQGALAYHASLKSVVICLDLKWSFVSEQPLGISSLNPGRDCLDILNANPGSPNGVYWLRPTEGGSPFRAYCDMKTDGGGWTMCYTTNNVVHVKTETEYDVTKLFGTDGYRTDCRDLPFNEVGAMHGSFTPVLMRRGSRAQGAIPPA